MTSTTTTLAASTNPSTFGSSVTFTATITPSPAGPTMMGSVSFYDGSVLLGTSPVMWSGSTGMGGLVVSSLLAGSHAITAAYSGDANHSPSTSSALTQTVNKFAPTVGGMAFSGAVYGQPIPLVGGVGGTGSVAPTGTITFSTGGTDLGSAALAPVVPGNAARGTLTVSTLGVGSNPISVSYGGDGNYTSRGQE